MHDEQEKTISDGSILYDDWKRSTFVGKLNYVWIAIAFILVLVPVGVLIFSGGKTDLDAFLPCLIVGVGMLLYADGVFIIETLFFARWIEKRKINYIPYLKKSFGKSKKNGKVVAAAYIVSHPSRQKKELVFAGLYVIGFVVLTILLYFIMLDFVNKNGWPVVKVVIASITFLFTYIVPTFLYSTGKDTQNILSWREHVIQNPIKNEGEGENQDKDEGTTK